MSTPLGLTAQSPLWQYRPTRDGSQSSGWNAGYSGSPVVDNGGKETPVGLPLRRTQRVGAAVELVFTGPGATLCFSPGAATFKITVDGAEVSSNQVKDASPENGCTTIAIERAFVVSDLDAGRSHTVRLEVTSAPNEFIFYGGGFHVPSAFDGRIADTTSVIADEALGWTLLPEGRGELKWAQAKHAGVAGGTATFNCIYGPDQKASYTFTDTVAVVLTGDRWPDAHSFTVEVDGVKTKLDATGTWQDGETVLFAQGGLDPKVQHTITLLNYNEDDDACETTNPECCVSFDELILLHVSDNAPSVNGKNDSSMMPTNLPTLGQIQTNEEHGHDNKGIIGAAVGGTIAGLVLLAIAIIVGIMLWRRHKRTRRWSQSEKVDLDAYTLQPATMTTSAAGATPSPARYSRIIDSEDGGGGVAPFYSGPPSAFASSGPSSSALAPVVVTGDRKNPRLFAERPAPPTPMPVGPPTEVGMFSPEVADSRMSVSVYSQADTAVGSQRMNRVDMEEVLQFVASRMDGQQPAPPNQDPFRDAVLPQYTR